MSNHEQTRTLWTKTLFEGLYTAIDKKDGKAVQIAVDDLRSKDFPLPEIMRHVQEDRGGAAVAILKQLLSGPVEDDSGLVQKLKNFFR